MRSIDNQAANVFMALVQESFFLCEKSCQLPEIWLQNNWRYPCDDFTSVRPSHESLSLMVV